jgi:phosphopantetheinyl transferase
MAHHYILSPLFSIEELSTLTKTKEWAESAHFPTRRRREYLSWRAVVYRELGDVHIDYDACGAPILTDSPRHISVSHSNEFVAVAISDKRCAIDIEPEGRNFTRATAKYLSADESRLLADPRLAGIVWCAKETLYKYAGIASLDFLHDMHITHIDLASGQIVGQIQDQPPLVMQVDFCRGLIVVTLF